MIKNWGDISLSEILATLGYTHRKGENYKQDIFHRGDYVGRMSCFECFAWLKLAGQIEVVKNVQ